MVNMKARFPVLNKYNFSGGTKHEKPKRKSSETVRLDKQSRVSAVLSLHASLAGWTVTAARLTSANCHPLPHDIFLLLIIVICSKSPEHPGAITQRPTINLPSPRCRRSHLWGGQVCCKSIRAMCRHATATCVLCSLRVEP